MKNIRLFISRLPFTLFMLLSISIASLVTNTTFQSITRHWVNRIGFAPNDLWYWRLERLVTSALVTFGGAVFWEAVFFILLAVGLAEWLTGWKRAALTFWGIHLLVLLLLSLTIALSIHKLREIGLEASLVARDVGPSAGYFACLGLVSARLKNPWNWISGAILFAWFVFTLFMPGAPGESATLKFSADLAHLIAFPLGWLSSRIVQKQKSPTLPSQQKSSAKGLAKHPIKQVK
jgi:hypothetical protein